MSQSPDPAFRCTIPIEVRFRDLDARNHVNNAVYFTYMEEARIKYLQKIGLLDDSVSDTSMIVAEATCTYKAPIESGQTILVRVRIAQLKNSSFIFEYSLDDAETSRVMATARSVQVCYDYARGTSVPIPDHWRERIERFERGE